MSLNQKICKIYLTVMCYVKIKWSLKAHSCSKNSTSSFLFTKDWRTPQFPSQPVLTLTWIKNFIVSVKKKNLFSISHAVILTYFSQIQYCVKFIIKIKMMKSSPANYLPSSLLEVASIIVQVNEASDVKRQHFFGQRPIHDPLSYYLSYTSTPL